MRSILVLALATLVPSGLVAQEYGEWSGSIEVGLRQHADPAEDRIDTALEFETTLEGNGQLGGHLFWDAEFYAFSSPKENTSRLDAQNATLTWRGQNLSVFAGQSTFSFGSALLARVADPINTKEFLAGPLNPVTLGQPVVGLRYATNQFEATAFALYGHRQAQVDSNTGRFSFTLPVKPHLSSYTAGRGEGDFGYALRLQHRGSFADIGALYFIGASRDTFLTADPLSASILARYPETEIFAVDAQANIGRFLVATEVVVETVNDTTETLFSLGAETDFTLNRASLTTTVQVAKDHGALRILGAKAGLSANLSALLTLNDAHSSMFEVNLGQNLDRTELAYIGLSYKRDIGPSSKLRPKQCISGMGRFHRNCSR